MEMIDHVKISDNNEYGNKKTGTKLLKKESCGQDYVKEFLGKNLGVIFGDEETLLVFGQQFSKIEIKNKDKK